MAKKIYRVLKFVRIMMIVVTLIGCAILVARRYNFDKQAESSTTNYEQEIVLDDDDVA